MAADDGFLANVSDLNKFPAKHFTDSNQWISLERELTMAELQAANTSPAVVIAAPAANEFIRLLGIHVSMDYNGTPYVGSDLVIRTIVSQETLFTIPEVMVEATADFCKYYSLADATVIDIGEGIEAYSGVDFTGNGSNIKITTEYRLIEI